VWSKVIWGCICGFLPVNVINSSGLDLFLTQFSLLSVWFLLVVCKYDSFNFFYQVVKFLMERNSCNSLHGQVTIGTLIFQVVFIFLPGLYLSMSLMIRWILKKVCWCTTTCLILWIVSGLCCWFIICFASSFGWQQWCYTRNDFNGEVVSLFVT
jgi:predicted Kef-type K+ transport protein